MHCVDHLVKPTFLFNLGSTVLVNGLLNCYRVIFCIYILLGSGVLRMFCQSGYRFVPNYLILDSILHFLLLGRDRP